tara:strand:+ start:1094 stop:1786 length:693 start_codon:yes stop_codon:yes gene_type:complete
MAVNVDTVYQRVLTVSNKEQRGYITPQEYNLLANQAQMQIFESYFFDKNLRERNEANRDPITSETDIDQLITRKLAPFTTIETVTGGHTFPDHFQIGKIFYNGYECRKVETNEIKRILLSVRHSGSEPIYTDTPTSSSQDINVYTPTTQAVAGVTCETITKPTNVAWGYVVVNGKALYNSNSSTNFSLHGSEEDTLVIKILELAGIIMNKPGLVQIAAQKDAIEVQTQKT